MWLSSSFSCSQGPLGILHLAFGFSVCLISSYLDAGNICYIFFPVV